MLHSRGKSGFHNSYFELGYDLTPEQKSGGGPSNIRSWIHRLRDNSNMVHVFLFQWQNVIGFVTFLSRRSKRREFEFTIPTKKSQKQTRSLFFNSFARGTILHRDPLHRHIPFSRFLVVDKVWPPIWKQTWEWSHYTSLFFGFARALGGAGGVHGRTTDQGERTTWGPHVLWPRVRLECN